MPFVTITMVNGYSEAFRQDLMARMTDLIRMLTGAPPNGVTIIINEIDGASYLRGRKRRTPGPPPSPPVSLVTDFLTAMEQRDLATAEASLADDFVMTFPGNVTFRMLSELVDWSKNRYRMVRKDFEGLHEVALENGALVYCHGTLTGEWPDGSKFSGIRFIDRFTVRDGKLIDQQVWNDMAEMRP